MRVRGLPSDALTLRCAQGGGIVSRISPQGLVFASRRQFLLGAAAVALLRNAPVSARQDGTPQSGEWSYTDDAGVTITRPTRPERVVAYLPLAAALQDYGVPVVGTFGVARKADGTPEVIAGDLDLEAIPNLGEVYGELDLEKLVSLQPDLFVNDKWTDELDIWGIGADGIAQLEAIVPVANIVYVERPVTEVIGSVETLAVALGADLSDPEIVAQQAAFERATADLKAAIAEKPGLRVLVMSGLPDDALWISSPRQAADLLFFQELGLGIIEPEGLTEMNLWEQLSWEQAGKYPADLFLIDARAMSASGPELVAAVPTFAALPAAKAGQFGAWDVEYVPSYKGFTPILQRLAETIRNSRVIGS